MFYCSPLFFLSVVSLFTPRLFQLHSSRTAAVWAEGRGGWWESEFLDGRLVNSADILFLLASVSSQPALWFARKTSTWVGFRPWAVCWWLRRSWTDDTLWMGMQVCHHGDRQSDRLIEESVAVLPSVPPPTPLTSHQTETPTCCRSALEPASSSLRLKFCPCALESRGDATFPNQAFSGCQATAGFRFRSKNSS